MKTKTARITLASRSPEQTQRLGSGKTCLTQGIAWGLGIKEYAFSPSFVIIREYNGRLPLYHIDFYRLDRIQEIADLGLDDYLCGKGLCVVEWADKGLALMPEEYLLINLSYVSNIERTISLEPRGHRYAELLKVINLDLRNERQ
jgi:tRNA threonylcarbamoyladenosine biosynthesis protein TsaE